MKEFKYITTQEELDSCISKFSDCIRLGVDLEFDKNRFAYGFTLSLIQVNFGEDIIVIDALCDLNLTEVFKILEDPTKQKVVFAFGEDIRLLHHVGCFAKNIYDLATGSKLLGFDQLSLSSLTEKVLGITDSGSSQKSNWLKRPLTEAQLKYAAEDVRNLFALQSDLIKQMERPELAEWLEQENSLFDVQDFSEEVSFSPIKNKDKKGLTAYEFFLFEQLMIHREEIAKKRNQAGYKLISKEMLLKLAKKEVKLGELMSRKDVSRHYKTKEVKNHIFELFKDSKDKAKAQGISLDDPAIKRLSQEEYRKWQEKKRVQQKIIREVFLPVKEELAKDYNKATSNFILSNKAQIEIATNGLKVALPYKQDLVKEYSERLNLPIDLLEKN